MRLSRAANYAIAALVHLAGRKDGQPLVAYLAAKEQGFPMAYLFKGLNQLVAAGILRSVRGPNGGYWLARRAKDISLLEIIEAVDGPIRSDGDFQGLAGSHVSKKLQAVWDRANEEIRRQLGKVRLSDLAGKA
jgi:Rrf2 family protein